MILWQQGFQCLQIILVDDHILAAVVLGVLPLLIKTICGLKGRIAGASSASVYTNAYFALRNACWGSAPSPFDLHFPMQAAHPGGTLLKMSIVTSYEKSGSFLA